MSRLTLTSIRHLFGLTACLLLLASCSQKPSNVIRTEPNQPVLTEYSFNAMAPLELTSIQQWQEFESDLKQAKTMGIDGISVDIWWGKVEAKGDQMFDWSYYHRMADLLAKYQLDWIPIMSFHQCGGNVGDTCDIPIPSWIWQHFNSVDANDLKFKSEQGNFSNETLSIWQSDAVQIETHRQYQQFMQAFESEFAHHANAIQELNVSMGPAGELRYPSYNGHDEGTGYPTRGAIQGLSEAALVSFSDYLVASKQVVSNPAEQIKQLDFDALFSSASDKKSELGRTYLTWYHDALVRHGKRMLATAHKGFSGPFRHIPLGYKIPGIHWSISATGEAKRSAELAAGMIAPDKYDESNAWGYLPILSIARAFQTQNHRPVFVHFTSLEMSNQPLAPDHSMVKSLVNWVAQGAQQLGVTLKGENALAAGIYHQNGWNNIEDGLSKHYSGLTVLRLGNVTDNQHNPVGHQRYKGIIEKHQTAASIKTDITEE